MAKRITQNIHKKRYNEKFFIFFINFLFLPNFFSKWKKKMKIYLSNGALLIFDVNSQFARFFLPYLTMIFLFATIFFSNLRNPRVLILRTKWTVRKVNDSHDEGSLAMRDKIASYKIFPGTHGCGRSDTRGGWLGTQPRQFRQCGT